MSNPNPIGDGALSPFKVRPKVYDDDTQIPHAIDAYATRLSAIRACATIHIPHARETAKSWADGVRQQVLDALSTVSELSEKGNRNLVVRFDRHLVREVVESTLAPHHDILAQSLLISGFSSFDAFLGTLLRTLYREQPQLVHGLKEKTLKYSEIQACKSIDEATNSIIERDISSLLRESYDTVFENLESRFGIGTLKKFDAWKDFVECSQRRNLVTHCDGVVDSQYISGCKLAGATLSNGVSLGTKLDVSPEYLDRAIDILHEVGVKLANTLWRKCLPDKAWVSEKFLTEHLYELLVLEQWSLAQTLGNFALSPPLKQINDLQIKMTTINYAQALKWGNRDPDARKVLELDWSGSIRDFRLAVDVLCDRCDNAIELMRQIGKSGELVKKDGYQDWPLFREFRKTPQFLATFQEIYGEPFELPARLKIRISSE